MAFIGLELYNPSSAFYPVVLNRIENFYLHQSTDAEHLSLYTLLIFAFIVGLLWILYDRTYHEIRKVPEAPVFNNS